MKMACQATPPSATGRSSSDVATSTWQSHPSRSSSSLSAGGRDGEDAALISGLRLGVNITLSKPTGESSIWEYLLAESLGGRSPLSIPLRRFNASKIRLQKRNGERRRPAL